ncbi:histidine phosphatase family protein [Aureibacillus halotolerans]|uniref:2,3-bisphosphoglycerate-dependent phosphoglycerate mutase n=1 Tax=Aureibacillus halotolerans TaxID=1508390 RepID=A0A4R6TMA8_9BACI|nr:histidine phosphatase family protein [Aureibacillus halotolerans]TDQ32160.1 2,3-bisphosphoglycerate-dependent phosphoglycerate mutase [Aureibacillus halotolerans]
MNTTVIYMVRHAESPFVFGAERTRGLSEEGHAAAKRVASYFETIPVDVICASTYERTKQTVQPTADAHGIPIEQYEELIERAIKDQTDKAPWEALVVAIRESFINHEYALKGGETTRQAQERAIPCIKQLLDTHQGKNIVIGTHGNIMTIIMNYYDPSYGFDFWESTSKPDIYAMTFDGQTIMGIERVWKEKDNVELDERN